MIEYLDHDPCEDCNRPIAVLRYGGVSTAYEYTGSALTIQWEVTGQRYRAIPIDTYRVHQCIEECHYVRTA